MDILSISDTSMVQKTNLSRKLTLGGITRAYPVYRVRLNLLFYNDQNDRIATWITQYKLDRGKTEISNLSREEYNAVIQQFIIDSNPSAIEKTKNNIALVNQREPGIALSDGRIIDGNRRFTCLRLLREQDPSFCFFETVILPDSDRTSQKQIKMLELAIQHGEEQRVDYNLIDLAIGAYHDIVETKLLTIEEYASSTNETVGDVKRRLETAQLIIEFLEFMGVPKHYHIAREMHVYSVFHELVPILKRCNTPESIDSLKKSVFSNTMMCTFEDQKKYIRSVRSMMDSGLFSSYIKRQNRIFNDLEEKKESFGIKSEDDLRTFVRENEEIKEDLQISFDRSLSHSKKAQIKSRPSQLVGKSISTLMDIDTQIIDRLSETEKEKLGNQLKRLTDTASTILGGVEEPINLAEPAVADKKSARPFASLRKSREPIIICDKGAIIITNLTISLPFKAVAAGGDDSGEATVTAVFTDENWEPVCPEKQFALKAGELKKINFSLNSSVSTREKCYLVIRSTNDAIDEAQAVMECKVKMAFQAEFGL